MLILLHQSELAGPEMGLRGCQTRCRTAELWTCCCMVGGSSGPARRAAGPSIPGVCQVWLNYVFVFRTQKNRRPPDQREKKRRGYAPLTERRKTPCFSRTGQEVMNSVPHAKVNFDKSRGPGVARARKPSAPPVLRHKKENAQTNAWADGSVAHGSGPAPKVGGLPRPDIARDRKGSAADAEGQPGNATKSRGARRKARARRPRGRTNGPASLGLFPKRAVAPTCRARARAGPGRATRG